MTDKEIEKWLNDTYRNMSDGYQTSLEHGGKADPDFEEQIGRLGAEIDYINRLKAERDYWKAQFEFQAEQDKNALIREQQIRKDTAKEILTDLLTLVNNNEDLGRGVLGWNTEEVKILIKLHIKSKYGVEVDDE